MLTFVLCVVDRHTDPKIYLFDDLDSAIEAAQRVEARYDYDEDDHNECPSEWSYYADLSCEGDYLFVAEGQKGTDYFENLGDVEDDDDDWFGDDDDEDEVNYVERKFRRLERDE